LANASQSRFGRSRLTMSVAFCPGMPAPASAGSWFLPILQREMACHRQKYQ
jgi:hypothetical protein